MATIRMKKGNLYADIFDSPETIQTAKDEGFTYAEEEVKTVVKPVETSGTVEETVVHKGRKRK